MNIEHMLVLSTAHVTEKVAKILDAKVNPKLHHTTQDWLPNLVIYPKGTPGQPNEYGWIIYIMDDANVDELDGCVGDCLRLARANQCRWIMFDRDEDTIDELQTYDW